MEEKERKKLFIFFSILFSLAKAPASATAVILFSFVSFYGKSPVVCFPIILFTRPENMDLLYSTRFPCEECWVIMRQSQNGAISREEVKEGNKALPLDKELTSAPLLALYRHSTTPVLYMSPFTTPLNHHLQNNFFY